MLLAALDDTLAQGEQAVMIGDTSFDMAMALAAGVRPIGVAWGYHSAAELLGAGADVVAQTPPTCERSWDDRYRQSAALAKARHKRLNGVRLFGVVLALVGAAIMAARWRCRAWRG
jgi:hypothetical protein